MKDPVVKGGCPQCGTYLYGQKAIRSTKISRGEHLDKGKHAEDKFVRCARCGWILNADRHLSAPEGARLGWGIRYEEVD
jgi:predicted nucleic-acid-binding Zn-ribbon protein